MGTRIIAKLNINPPHVVKPVYFEGLRKIGTIHKSSESIKKYI